MPPRENKEKITWENQIQTLTCRWERRRENDIQQLAEWLGLIVPTTEKASWFTISSAENYGWNFQMPPWCGWCPVAAWAQRQACVAAFVWFAELDRELAAFERAREDWSLELLPSCSSAGQDQKLSEKDEWQGPQVNDKKCLHNECDVIKQIHTLTSIMLFQRRRFGSIVVDFRYPLAIWLEKDWVNPDWNAVVEITWCSWARVLFAWWLWCPSKNHH